MAQKRSLTKNRLAQILNSPDKGIKRTSGVAGSLSRLFRIILRDLDVMGPRFGALMNQFVTSARQGGGGADTKHAQTSLRGNLTKEFARDQMTWKVFCKGLRFLQFTKVEIWIKAHHASGKVSIHGDVVNLRLDEPYADFEAELEQDESMEATGEHIPVLDDVFEREREGLVATAEAMEIPRGVNLKDGHWYVYSPSTKLVYDDLGYRFLPAMSEANVARVNEQALAKWRDTQPDVQVVSAEQIRDQAVSYFSERPKVAPRILGQAGPRINDDDWYIWSPTKQLIYSHFSSKELGSLVKLPNPAKHPLVEPVLAQWRDLDPSAMFSRGLQLYGQRLEWYTPHNSEKS